MKKHKKILLALFLVPLVLFLAIRFWIPAIIAAIDSIKDFIDHIGEMFVVIVILFLLGYLAWGLENQKSIAAKVISNISKAILFLLFGSILIYILVKNVMDWF